MSKAERRRTRVSSTIDRLPDDIRGQLDLKLTDPANTYEELAAWLKGEGYDISKSAIGRYAIRSTQAAQRVAETLQRTQAIARAVEAHPDLDYTKAASMVLMDGLMQRVSTAEEEFDELPLDKAGRLIASLSRNATYDGVTPYQAENIFRTNVQTAYNVGHYKQMTDPDMMELRPYWQYDAVNDSRTRPSHLAMDGRVFPADSPVWDTWFPPNGFKCRCTVRTLSKRQVERMGLQVETQLPKSGILEDGRFVNLMPDPHFATNPAKTPWRPDLEA